MAKTKLDKELALKIAKAAEKASKKMGITSNKKPHK
jgi:hypothetical protein